MNPMVKLNQKNNKEVHQCEECGLRYIEKEWAEQCGAWCKEHKSCNIEIIAHAVQDKSGEDVQTTTPLKSADDFPRLAVLKTVFKQPFYLFVAIDGALALGLLYWWLLSKTTTWVTFYMMYNSVPLYFWPYVLLTLISTVLFGVSLAVAVYSWQHSKLRSIKGEGGTAFGAGFGALGAACPVCGSFLLSAVGIAGGVAILPFQGLELKLLSAGFLGVVLFLSTKKLSEAVACHHTKNFDVVACEACEVNHVRNKTPEASVAMNARASNGVKSGELTEAPKKTNEFSYQTLLAVLFLVILFAAPLFKQEQVAASVEAKNGTLLTNKINNAQNVETGNPLYDEVVKKVLPPEGFQTRIVLGDAITKLVSYGVIDLEKFKQIYGERGISEKELAILTQPSNEPLKIDDNNAGLLVNLLWSLGLANKTEFNKKSPVKGESIFNFASTGGWTLGKEDNGGKYFNKFEIVKLTPEQEVIALEIAQSTYRPCCNNSTFFQDCNHGSALLGLIELGASQGLSKDELYKAALQFNSFWFPQNYIETALYYKLARNTDWEDINPKEIMGLNYSSVSGWVKNVGQPFKEIAQKNPDLLPKKQGGAGCGV